MYQKFRIKNKGSFLEINQEGSITLIGKLNITDISVIKEDVIKIGINRGGLQQVFIPFKEIAEPLAESISALRDSLAEMVFSFQEALMGKMQEQIDSIILLEQKLELTKELLTTQFNQPRYPSLIDVTKEGLILRGYRILIGTSADRIWAIQREETISPGITQYTWANGSKAYTNIWDERKDLNYL
jgi:hypothetical protein